MEETNTANHYTPSMYNGINFAKKKKKYLVIIALLTVINLILASLLLYLVTKERSSRKAENGTTIVASPTPTDTVMSHTPTPEMPKTSTYEQLIDLSFDKLPYQKHSLHIELPETAYITVLEGANGRGKKADPRIDIPKPLDTLVEITDTQNPSEYKLFFSTPLESQIQARATIVDLKPTQNFSQLYRSPVSSTDPTLWGYATNAKSSGQCTLSNKVVNAPCSSNELVLNYTDPKENPVFIQAYCEAKTESGLMTCDEIIKSIRLKN